MMNLVQSIDSNARPRLCDRGDRHTATRCDGQRPFRRILSIALLTLGGLWAGNEAEAQVRRGRPVDTGSTWAPISIGPRLGFDQRGQGTVVGGQLRIPVIRSGQAVVLPTADITFRRGGRRETQYTIEAVYAQGWPRGGLYGGGGVGWRTNFVVDDNPVPDTHFGLNLVVGLTTGLVGPLVIVVEFRWIFIEGVSVDPTPATFGVSLPLWRTGQPEGS
jgi:hypothetical protein